MCLSPFFITPFTPVPDELVRRATGKTGNSPPGAPHHLRKWQTANEDKESGKVPMGRPYQPTAKSLSALAHEDTITKRRTPCEKKVYT